MPAAGTWCCFPVNWPPGEVRRLHYFDRAAGRLPGRLGPGRHSRCLLSAHLGAHLASDGGRLRGDLIACPFHGWTFDTDGRCVDIPYAEHIPDKAVEALRGWPVLEKNGFIALWYDLGGQSARGLPARQ